MALLALRLLFHAEDKGAKRTGGSDLILITRFRRINKFKAKTMINETQTGPKQTPRITPG